MNSETTKKDRQKVLTEVWGDTVNLKELMISVVLGVIFTMAFYIAGRTVFQHMDSIDPDLAKGYALIGVLGGFLNNNYGIHTGVQFMAYYASGWIVTSLTALCGVLL